MNFYPYQYPIILTDEIFDAHGGILSDSKPALRQIAYTVAEEAVSDDIGTLLLPTIVTGTASWNLINPIITEYGYVNSVHLVRFLDTRENIYFTASGTANVYVSLRDDTYGLIDIHRIFGNCQCISSSNPYPYQVQYVYQAGLPTGTANAPKILLALTTYSDMVLNQIEGYGNEADGLVGVSEFKNQDYSEVRHNLKQTIFGSSARSQFVSGLLTKYRKHRYVKLGL
jgi:hypothetical protein